jgi:glycerol-3-phosphate dehydrogenase subunit C
MPQADKQNKHAVAPVQHWLPGSRLVAQPARLGRLGCGLTAPFVNRALQNRHVRLLLEYALGLPRALPLPTLATYSLRSWFKYHFCFEAHVRQRLQTNRHLVYYTGCAANYSEPWIGRAAISVLEHNGWNVILARQRCCGQLLLRSGAHAAARQYHEHNIAHLLPYARRGLPIIGTSPGCLHTLRAEATSLLDMHSADTRLVAEQSYDIFAFLRLLHQRGELRTDFRPMPQRVAYHAPQQPPSTPPALDILALIPGLSVRPMAHSPADAQHSSLVLCEAETCRWQLRQDGSTPGQHPIELLWQAYQRPAHPEQTVSRKQGK